MLTSFNEQSATEELNPVCLHQSLSHESQGRWCNISKSNTEPFYGTFFYNLEQIRLSCCLWLDYHFGRMAEPQCMKFVGNT